MNRILAIWFILCALVASGQRYHKCTVYAAVGLDTSAYHLRAVQTLNDHGRIVEEVGYTRWMPCNRPYPDSPVEKTTYYYTKDTIPEKTYFESRDARSESWQSTAFHYGSDNHVILDTTIDSSFWGRHETVTHYEYDIAGNKVSEQITDFDGSWNKYTLFRKDGLPFRITSHGFTNSGGDSSARIPWGTDSTEYSYMPGRMEAYHIDANPNSKYETLSTTDSAFADNKLVKTETTRYKLKPTGKEEDYFQTVEFGYYPEPRKSREVSGYYGKPGTTEVLVYKYDER